MDDETFQLVRECFEKDDGSLPGVLLVGLTPGEIAGIYASIRSRSRLSSNFKMFWHSRDGKELELDAVLNAAELVACGDADPFHFCFVGLVVRDVELPELGLFVFPDCVELDYRMGSDWTREKVDALFGLLHELFKIAPNATLSMPKSEHPPNPDRFLWAWARYRGISD